MITVLSPGYINVSESLNSCIVTLNALYVYFLINYMIRHQPFVIVFVVICVEGGVEWGGVCVCVCVCVCACVHTRMCSISQMS